MARRAVRSVVLAAAVAGLLALQAAAAVETPVEKQLQQEEQQLQLDEHIAGWSPFRIPAVDAVDINAYTGRWFQVRGSAVWRDGMTAWFRVVDRVLMQAPERPPIRSNHHPPSPKLTSSLPDLVFQLPQHTKTNRCTPTRSSHTPSNWVASA